MADTSNGLMYGVAAVCFMPYSGEQKAIELGWLDESGMQPTGNAPTFMDVVAAQVTDGPVDSIMTNPGSDAFTMNLIQLKAKNMVDVFGGSEEDGAYFPPDNFVSIGLLLIKMHSGHVFCVYKARLSKSGWQNGMNMQNVLALNIRVDMLKSEEYTYRFSIMPPGTEIPDITTAAGTADKA